MKLSFTKIIALFFLFTVLGSIVYSNTLDVTFILDDVIALEVQPDIRLTSLSPKDIWNAGFGGTAPLSRPIAKITFALDYYFHQYDLAGYHIVNIAIHILTGFFLFLFIYATLGIIEGSGRKGGPLSASSGPAPLVIAALTAVIWFVNPLDTQSVTYIVQRQNSMAAMFYVLSLLLYIKGRMVLKPREERPEPQAQTQPRDLSPKGKKKKRTGRAAALDLEKGDKSTFRKNRNHSSKGKENARSDSAPPARYPYLCFCGSALVWILALGCKQTAVALPFFVVLYEWFFFQELKRDWLKANLKYAFLAFALFAIIAILYLGLHPWEKILSLHDFANREFTFKQRILTEFRVVIYYLSLIFYPNPSRLNLDYDFALSHSLFDPITTLLSLCTIIGLIGLACYLAKSRRLISFCIFWFFGNLVIESSVIPLAIIFEHRTYLPSMLIVLPVVMLFYRYGRKAWLVNAVLCGVIVLFSYWTYQRNAVWADEVALYRDCVKKSPQKARPRYNLGRALMKREQIDEAIQQYLEAVHIQPDYADAHYNLAHALSQKGQMDKAIEHYMEAVRIRPDFYKAYYNLGIVLQEEGRTDEAIQQYLEAIRVKPDLAMAHYNLGVLLQKEGRTDEAAAHYLQAVRIDPGLWQAHYNLGLVLQKEGKPDAAIEQFSRALQINPNAALIHYHLGEVLQEQGRSDAAIEHYVQALRLDPNLVRAHNNLGIALFDKGNLQEAIHHFRQALRIQPNFATARSNLLKALELQEQNQSRE